MEPITIALVVINLVFQVAIFAIKRLKKSTCMSKCGSCTTAVDSDADKEPVVEK